MNFRCLCFLVVGLGLGLIFGRGSYLFFPVGHSAVVTSPGRAVPNLPLTGSTPDNNPEAAPPNTPAKSGAAMAPIYRYNAFGQLQQIIYPDRSTYSYQYDAFGDKISETDTTGKTWTYVYDQNHQAIRVIDPEGRAANR
jgi:YD repeat-containing protein